MLGRGEERCGGVKKCGGGVSELGSRRLGWERLESGKLGLRVG